MAWKSLSERLPNLPLILAGPMLRRTETSSVTVWLALRHPALVSLKVYLPSISNPRHELRMSGSLATTQLGNNLHIVAVTASTNDVSKFLLEGYNYCYDLDFEVINFSKLPTGRGRLDTPYVFSVNGGLDDICYQAYSLPSFAIPPSDLKKLHILHGSCRKPHGGEGERDALPYADDIIKEYMGGDDIGNYITSRPEERPHQFYHTGDQIYADDVAESLLYMIDDASKSLFGWVESLAVLDPEHLDFANESVTQPLPQDPVFVANTPSTTGNKGATDTTKYSIQPGQRLDVVQKLAGFSSDVTGGSHLMRLGEYSCMYLFVWSDLLWPEYTDSALSTINYPTFKQVMPWANETLINISDGGWPIGTETSIKQDFDNQLATLSQFRNTLKKVRRVLANVPSYMMCDDHEVTDDWFIGNKWCNRVYGSELGKRIVQNGLTAFAIFQAWGNKPNDFKTGNFKPESILLDSLLTLATDQGKTQANWKAIQARVLPARQISTTKEQGNIEGRETSELSINGVLDYSFCISFGKFALLAINSRTERGLVVDPNPRIGPALLHPSAMKRQVTDQVAKLPASVEVTLVICPAPVFGHPVIERILQKTISDLDNVLVTTPRGVLMYPNPVGIMSEGGLRPIADTDWNEGDREGWAFNAECMQSLLKELSPCKKVILFSGDVHYGFSPYVDYHRRFDPTSPQYPTRASFIQLVCSSMKNSTQVDTVSRAGNLVSYSVRNENDPYYFAGWDKPGFHNYEVIEGVPELYKVRQKPYTPYQSSFYLTELTDPVADIIDMTNDAPSWSYSVRLARDTRDFYDRFSYNAEYLDDQYTPSAVRPIRFVENIFIRHRRLTQNLAVGHTQIGQVKLDLSQGYVYHNFWFKKPDRADASKPGPVTQHKLIIAPV